VKKCSDSAGLKDVAKLAGVSISTASYSVNGTGGSRVSEALRSKVLKAARVLHYMPNSLGRSLRTDHSRLIGVIFPTFCHYSTPENLQGIEDELSKHDYGMLFYSYNDIEELKHKFQTMLTKRVEGILLFPESPKNTEFYALYKQMEEYVPVVAIGGNYQEELPKVMVDGEIVGRSVAEYLYSCGHRRISFMCDFDAQTANGYRKVWAEKGLEFHSEYIFCDFSKPITGERFLDWLLAFPIDKRPTAVYTCSDEYSGMIVHASAFHNIRIPHELSVLGADGLGWGGMLTPALSCIYQPHYQQGAAGAKILMDILRGKEKYNISLHPELLIRDSVYDLVRERVSQPGDWESAECKNHMESESL